MSRSCELLGICRHTEHECRTECKQTPQVPFWLPNSCADLDAPAPTQPLSRLDEICLTTCEVILLALVVIAIGGGACSVYLRWFS